MKRIFTYLICICLLLCPAAVLAEDEPIEIASREDLEKLTEHPQGSFVLTDDIDVGAWTPVAFSGTLSGNGHTLYNLTVRAPGAETYTVWDGNRIEYEAVGAGLFSVVTGATVRDLRLAGASVEIETDRDCFVGTLAGIAVDSVFEACTVDCRDHLTITSACAGVGGMAGFSVNNRFDQCAVDAELVFTDDNTETPCEEFMGGVYASGCGDVREGRVRMRGFAEIYGYAHNGGVVGMIKLPRKQKKLCAVSKTAVDVEISFFEIAPSRRAYCDPLLGENLAKDCRSVNNEVLHFESFESETPVRLSPERCEAPRYTAQVTPPACGVWGYTDYTCETCGYSYRADYTHPQHTYAETRHEPTCTEDGSVTYTCTGCGDSYSETLPATGHVPGAFEQIAAPTETAEGEERQVCTVCGAVLETRAVPVLPAVPDVLAESVTLSETALALRCGEETRLSAAVAPDSVTTPGVRFQSTDETVATVSEDGTVHAVGRGTAEIVCSSADGAATARCTVTVSFTLWQWIRHYILFGWVGES